MSERQQNYPDSTGARWDSGQGGRRSGAPERSAYLDRTEPMSQQDRAASAADSSLDGFLGARERGAYRATSRPGDMEAGTRPVPQARGEATSWSMERKPAKSEPDYPQNSRVVDPELAAASGVETRSDDASTQPQQPPRPPVQMPPEPSHLAALSRPQSAPPQAAPPQSAPPHSVSPQSAPPQPPPPQHNAYGYGAAAPQQEAAGQEQGPGYGAPVNLGGNSTAFDEPTQLHGSVSQQHQYQPPADHMQEPAGQAPRRQGPEQVADGVYRRNRPALGVAMALVTVAMMGMTVFMLVRSALGDGGLGPSVILSATFAMVGLPLSAWGMYPLLGMGANSGPEDFRVLLRPPYAYLLVGLILVLAAGMAA